MARVTVSCAECGKEYDYDNFVDIGQRIKYFCECGCEVVWKWE